MRVQMGGSVRSKFNAVMKGNSMLVLSRKKGETIVIGDDIRVTIVDVRNDKVRVGIDASRQVAVHREEVYDAIQKGADKPSP